MKKITGLVVILAALVLGSYYGMGYLTEKKVKEDLNIINQSNGLAVKLVDYKRGWFSSKAVLDWTLQVPQRVIQSAEGKSETIPAQDYQMQMPATIYHGPIIFSDKGIKFGLGYANTSLNLPEKYVEQFNNSFTSESTQPTLDLSLFVNYLANSSFDLSVPAFKLFSKKGDAQFDWLGMTTSTDISSSMDKVDGTISIDGLRVNKDQIKTTMSSITSEYNLHKSPLGFYLGDASLAFPSLVVMSSDKKIFELGQFNLHSDTNIEDGLFSSHFKSSIEKVIANDKTYGPGNIELAIRNLDADVLARINAEINQMQQGPEADRQRAMLAMLPELPKLFAKGAELEIAEMNFVVPEGTIEGNLIVSLPKGDTGNPFQLVQKIHGNGKIKIPAAILKEVMTESNKQKLAAPQDPQSIQQSIVQQMQQQAANPADSGKAAVATTTTPAVVDPNSPEVVQQALVTTDKQLAAMVQSGLLTQNGSDYVLEVKLDQGQFMVNGKAFNPAMMNF